MCGADNIPIIGNILGAPKINLPAPKPAAQVLAAPGDAPRRQGDLEARMRLARQGAAADVLTSPEGLATTFGGAR